MSKPKSILKKPSGSFPTASSSGHPEQLPRDGVHYKGKAKASGSKLRQSIPVKPSKRPSKRNEEDSDESESEETEGAELEEGDGFGEDSELGTDEEINRSKGEAKGKTARTKRKAPTSAETFGSTLTALLSEPGPSKRVKTEGTSTEDTPIGQRQAQPKRSDKKSQAKPSVTANPILSLSNAKLPPSKASVSLERRAARKVKQEKEEKEDRARVRNVVEGWTAADGTGGMEFEKGLRKVAQKGVIKLFNAILVASKSSEGAATTLSAKAGLKEEKGRRKEKDNLLGRGGKVAEGKGLTSESFLDLVRKG